MECSVPLRRKHGPPRRLRRRLNPKLYDAVRSYGVPGWQVAHMAGLNHQTILSSLIRSNEVPNTAINIERLERIAAVVGFPREDLFLDVDR